MPLIIANLNPTDRVRVSNRAHALGVAPPVPAYTPAIDGRNIVLADVPTDRELQFDNRSGLLRGSVDPADFTAADTAPINKVPPSFGWGPYDDGTRIEDILILNSGSWIVSDTNADQSPGRTTTYTSRLIHPDTTVLWTATDPDVPEDGEFRLGEGLHGLTLTFEVTAVYDDDGSTTTASIDVPIPAYVEPPNLWLSMLNDPNTSISYKGTPDMQFSFDEVTGDVTITFPTFVPEGTRKPRIGIGSELNPNLDHTISFEIHAASEEEGRLVSKIIGSRDKTQIFDIPAPLLTDGSVTISDTMAPTESGGYRFDLGPSEANTPGTIVLRDVQIRET